MKTKTYSYIENLEELKQYYNKLALDSNNNNVDKIESIIIGHKQGEAMAVVEILINEFRQSKSFGFYVCDIIIQALSCEGLIEELRTKDFMFEC